MEIASQAWQGFGSAVFRATLFLDTKLCSRDLPSTDRVGSRKRRTRDNRGHPGGEGKFERRGGQEKPGAVARASLTHAPPFSLITSKYVEGSCNGQHLDLHGEIDVSHVGAAQPYHAQKEAQEAQEDGRDHEGAAALDIPWGAGGVKPSVFLFTYPSAGTLSHWSLAPRAPSNFPLRDSRPPSSVALSLTLGSLVLHPSFPFWGATVET